ncbi:hypothetical protein PENTCL1PPCAC_16983, partial [Pristionchus entomophagus]
LTFSSMDAWSIILFVLGYLFLALVALRLLASLYRIIGVYFLCSRRDLHARAGARWAVITGATDGIGKAYAFELADQKFDIFLVSRTASKLFETKKEILEKIPGVNVASYAFDFTAPTHDDYQPLLNELAKIEVGVLVNNVGMAIDCPEAMHEVEGGIAALARISTCNSLPVIILSSSVLEQMVKRKKGVIINISSAAALTEMAYWNVYSAGKRFMLHLSNILRQEYSPHGITVQCITPMGVSTKLKIVDTIVFFEPSATKFARSALKTVGVIGETTGYFAHQIQAEMIGLMPTWLANKLMAIFNLKLRASIHAKRANKA